MRNKQQRAVERLNRLLNPLTGCKIKVVGRLVEDEQIERIVHQLTQAQTAFLTAGQHIHGFQLGFTGKLERTEPVSRHLHGHVLVVDERVDEVAVRIGKIHLLRQVRRLESNALADDAAIRHFLAEQDFQHGGLSGAVCAKQRDALAIADVERYVMQYFSSVITLCNITNLEHFLRLVVRVTKRDGHLFVGLGPVSDLHTRNALLDGRGTLRQMLGAVLVHGTRSRLQTLFLRQLVLVVLELLLTATLTLDRIVRVIAVVEIAGAIVDFNHAVAALVDKPAVMRDNEHGAAVILQIIAQPVHSVHIEVVGRLIEQQHIGLLKNDAGEVNARFFAAGEQVKLLRTHFLRDFKTVAYAVDLVIAVVAAEDFQPRFQLRVALEQRCVIRLARHFVGQRVHCCRNFVGLLERQTKNVLHGRFRRKIRHLVNDTGGSSLSERNVSAVIRQPTGQNIKQSGLSSAVCA